MLGTENGSAIAQTTTDRPAACLEETSAPDASDAVPAGKGGLSDGEARPACLASVLVVDDTPVTRRLVEAALSNAGYQVRVVADAAAALEAARTASPDIAILDVGLPDMTGWQLCERLRADLDLPVIFLTASGSDSDIVHGLRVGADDYLVKPFSPAVLVARVEAVLRRAHARPSGRAVRLPGLTIDVGRATVERDHAPVSLTASELRILAALSQRPGAVLDARQLALATQGYDLPRDEASRLIKVHISNLRQKLEPDPKRPSYILTVRGIGYRLNVERRRADS